MAAQFGRLRQILDEISPDESIPLIFVDWAIDHPGQSGTPLRDKSDFPIVKSAGAAIGQKGFFEIVCKDMVEGIFALNPLDAETRHVDSYAMETYFDDGTYHAVDLANADEYAEVKAFLEQTLVQ